VIKTIIKQNSYLDSIFLMNAGKELKKVGGVNEAILVMGSEMNKTVLEELGQLTPEAAAAAPNDLIISLDMADESRVDAVLQRFEELTASQTAESRKDGAFVYPTMELALTSLTDANLALISVPGEFAASVAERALDKGLHTFIFSDNVPLAEEVELKKKAQKKGLMVMGPGCGAGLINQVALGLMSMVGEGPIGIVGASGSGLQEIAILIDHLGSGISQAIGTGGRDPSAEVGGITMLQGLKCLAEDQQTKVIVLVSKPPAGETAEKIFKVCKAAGKPVVINFLGGDRKQIENAGAIYAATLEEAAVKALQLLGDSPALDKFIEEGSAPLLKLADEEKKKLKSGEQQDLRGLFCGGTHSEEAVLILQEMTGPIYSNLEIGSCKQLDSSYNSGHKIIDLGAEEFTRGKPHPVIDPSLLNEWLWREGTDPRTAVLLFDIILGYGAHPDPVDVIAPTLSALKEKAQEGGSSLSIIASLCGSTKDPQNYFELKKRLEKIGVLVFSSNARAAFLAGKIIS